MLVPPVIGPAQHYTYTPAGTIVGHVPEPPKPPAQTPAIIVAPPGHLTEDRVPPAGLLATGGRISVIDPDPGEGHLVPTAVETPYGYFEVQADGHWSYVANNEQAAVQRLPAGATLTDSIIVHSVDGTPFELKVIFTGTNDQPSITAAPGDVTEDRNVTAQGDLVASGHIQVVDPDQGESAVAPQVLDGHYGTFTVAPDGTWTYTADNSQPAIQHLDRGDTLADRATLHSADGTPFELRVTIHGTNDAPTIVSVPGDVAEDRNVTASGMLVAHGMLTVTNPDGSPGQVLPATQSGSYGQFHLQADGSWTYTAQNAQSAIQGLNTGQQLTDSVTMRGADGTPFDLRVVIHGADEPYVAASGGGSGGHVPHGLAHGYWSHAAPPPPAEPELAPYLATLEPSTAAEEPSAPLHPPAAPSLPVMAALSQATDPADAALSDLLAGHEAASALSARPSLPPDDTALPHTPPDPTAPPVVDDPIQPL